MEILIEKAAHSYITSKSRDKIITVYSSITSIVA
ncbi:MAG: hypothetical protein H6Q66_540 [Firmicutes bacterium]|nr:hypothetical protein [Bacillota bacterium]